MKIRVSNSEYNQYKESTKKVIEVNNADDVNLEDPKTNPNTHYNIGNKESINEVV